MKLYNSPFAPNPRRVRIFLAEKGLAVPTVDVDLARLDQRSEDFSALNPFQTVPALTLDDGVVLAESIAICRYFEEIQPDPPLFGVGALGAGAGRDVAAPARDRADAAYRPCVPPLPSAYGGDGAPADRRTRPGEQAQGGRRDGADRPRPAEPAPISPASASASPTSPAWSRSISPGRRGSPFPKTCATSGAGTPNSPRGRAPRPEPVRRDTPPVRTWFGLNAALPEPPRRRCGFRGEVS